MTVATAPSAPGAASAGPAVRAVGLVKTFGDDPRGR